MLRITDFNGLIQMDGIIDDAILKRMNPKYNRLVPSNGPFEATIGVLFINPNKQIGYENFYAFLDLFNRSSDYKMDYILPGLVFDGEGKWNDYLDQFENPNREINFTEGFGTRYKFNERVYVQALCSIRGKIHKLLSGEIKLSYEPQLIIVDIKANYTEHTVQYNDAFVLQINEDLEQASLEKLFCAIEEATCSGDRANEIRKCRFIMGRNAKKILKKALEPVAAGATIIDTSSGFIK